MQITGPSELVEYAGYSELGILALLLKQLKIFGIEPTLNAGTH